MLKSLLIGFASIALGCLILWHRYKNPVRKDYDFTQLNVKGYIAGIGFIILGILTLIGWGIGNISYYMYVIKNTYNNKKMLSVSFLLF
jgi:hypothetical protein